ncbi:uncharacterized protein MKK02DRAFT_33817 [Dioszegia hungarica]|uniref:Uncharacterized protein n=1 Tax=Dioszegia hungarica TaxID=4972 RepID=A0AA38HAK3_9TREE|nr:uncharacterized protein MKK02DRAFT_33817 [Dioszegia hungarica]KAI9636681.1 hypothetical protein MKK02DRAFT_33817 [Dioszegia hungarica]
MPRTVEGGHAFKERQMTVPSLMTRQLLPLGGKAVLRLSRVGVQATVQGLLICEHNIGFGVGTWEEGSECGPFDSGPTPLNGPPEYSCSPSCKLLGSTSAIALARHYRQQTGRYKGTERNIDLRNGQTDNRVEQGTEITGFGHRLRTDRSGASTGSITGESTDKSIKQHNGRPLAKGIERKPRSRGVMESYYVPIPSGAALTFCC